MWSSSERVVKLTERSSTVTVGRGALYLLPGDDNNILDVTSDS